MAFTLFRKHCPNIMFYPLVQASIAITAYDYGQDFCFYHKVKRKQVEKTLEQCFLEKLKATSKISGKIVIL